MKSLKFILTALLVVTSIGITSMVHSKNSDTAPEECGGRSNYSDSNAPKKIESKEIVSCNIEFPGNEKNSREYYSLEMEKRDGWVLYKLNRKDYEAPLSSLDELQKIIDRFDMAKKNGDRHETHGIPEGLGYKLYVKYASGEYISAYDNAGNGFTKEELDALNNFAKSLPVPSYPEIAITSKDLKNEMWDISIAWKDGVSVSPQLSWKKVKGAKEYAVFMFAYGDYMSMRALNVNKTSLEKGDVKDYSGPYYKDKGKRIYSIYVYALKSAPDATEIGKYKTLNKFSEIERALDTSNGKRGNIIGRGILKGYYDGKIFEIDKENKK